MENDNTKNQGVVLLPCPFCGREDKIKEIYHPQPMSGNMVLTVAIKHYEFECGYCKKAKAGGYTRKEAIAAWNTRNPAPSRMTENEANKNVGDLVEMVARAICEADDMDPDRTSRMGMGSSFDNGIPRWKDYEQHAQAALSVIRQQSSVKVDDGAIYEALKNMIYYAGLIVHPKRTGIIKPTMAMEQLEKAENILEALRSSEMPNGSTQHTGENNMNDEQIKHMTNRFLGWKLPEDFRPDAGISFKPAFNEHLPEPMKHEPSGTNLFDYTQAEAMVRYMLEGMPNGSGKED